MGEYEISKFEVWVCGEFDIGDKCEQEVKRSLGCVFRTVRIRLFEMGFVLFMIRIITLQWSTTHLNYL